MRGSLHMVMARRKRAGIIPAHAGLTSVQGIRIPLKRDHPRACGAHQAVEQAQKGGAGSSPRMRGSLAPGPVRVQCTGIIPAHAGLTTNPHTSDDSQRDHPRACGAHSMSDNWL